jgi:hypothetical protein
MPPPPGRSVTAFTLATLLCRLGCLRQQGHAASRSFVPPEPSNSVERGWVRRAIVRNRDLSPPARPSSPSMRTRAAIAGRFIPLLAQLEPRNSNSTDKVLASSTGAANLGRTPSRRVRRCGFKQGSFRFHRRPAPPSSADTNLGGDDKEKAFAWVFEIHSSS